MTNPRNAPCNDRFGRRSARRHTRLSLRGLRPAPAALCGRQIDRRPIRWSDSVDCSQKTKKPRAGFTDCSGPITRQLPRNEKRLSATARRLADRGCRCRTDRSLLPGQVSRPETYPLLKAPALRRRAYYFVAIVLLLSEWLSALTTGFSIADCPSFPWPTNGVPPRVTADCGSSI